MTKKDRERVRRKLLSYRKYSNVLVKDFTEQYYKTLSIYEKKAYFYHLLVGLTGDLLMIQDMQDAVDYLKDMLDYNNSKNIYMIEHTRDSFDMEYIQKRLARLYKDNFICAFRNIYMLLNIIVNDPEIRDMFKEEIPAFNKKKVVLDESTCVYIVEGFINGLDASYLSLDKIFESINNTIENDIRTCLK